MMDYKDENNFIEYYNNGNKHRVLKNGVIKKFDPDGKLLLWTKNGLEIFYDFDGNKIQQKYYSGG